MTTSARVRVALIGCGLAAQRTHLPAYFAAPEAEITGLASRRLAHARAVAKEFGNPRIFASWKEAVVDPAIDAVDICTPNALHAPIAVAAARAGKHVIVEKPMATTLADADAMITAAREAHVVLMVAHTLRFSAVSQAMRRAMYDGVIGRPFSARGVFMHAGPDEFWGATADWFWNQDGAGGGSLLDLGIHMIDLMRWILGLDAQEVLAMTARRLKPTFADDNAMVMVRFDGDVLGSIQSSWTARPFPDRELVIHGERGHLAMHESAEEPLIANVKDRDGWKRTALSLPPEDKVTNPFVHFVRSILSGVTPLVTGEDGRASLEIALAAYESARTGAIVHLKS